MKTGLSQSARLGQELRANPRLYQAMDMLYMPLLDLQQHLKQELLVNPFLELADDDEDAGAAADESSAEDADEDGDETVDAATDAATENVGDAADDSGVAADIDDATDGADGADDDLAGSDLADSITSTDTDVAGDDADRWDEVLQEGFEPTGAAREEHEEREYRERAAEARTDLADHLFEQVRMLELTPRMRILVEECIGHIGDDGYLGTTLEQVLQGVNALVTRAAESAGRDIGDLPLYTRAEVEEALGVVQSLDPPGVGARDIRECLLLQLRDAGQAESMAAALVRDHFDDLVAHRWAELARRLGVAPADVQAAADEIAKLSPKPGLAQANVPDHYVIPDLIVEKVEGEYLVFVNDGNLPRLRLSRAYRDVVRNRRALDAEHKEFIATKLNAAQWLIQAIEQRRQTMLKVMHFIVNRQRDFLDRGIQHLKPLTLREVAEAIDMHESTVSRVTNDKYAQTPRGVLPLKFFFSSGISTVDGEDVSARGIKATISQLVADEDPRAPLTDQAIVETLAGQGVQIARRTVAKYREQLGILSARMRKRV